MTGRTTTSRRARRGREEADLAPDDPGAIRNVVLVGPSAAGKTTLVEELLADSGTISRAGSVTAGTTVCDHDPAARRQQRSVALSVAPVRHRGVKINLIDTPGCPDFLCEVRAGLRAADAVLFVVAAPDLADGADARTALLWEECVRTDLPRAVVLSRLDHARADVAAALAAVEEGMGSPGAVLTPVSHLEPGPEGAVGALLGPDVADPLTSDADGVDGALRELVETVIEQSEDEALLESWISGDPVPVADLRAALATTVARRVVVPVMGVCAAEHRDLDVLLDLVVDVVPPPTAHPPLPAHGPDGTGHPAVAPDPDGPLVAEVVHTDADTQTGRVSLLRVFSGRLQPDSVVTVAHDPARTPPGGATDEAPAERATTARVGRVYSPLGATLREVPAGVAGDLCALTRLSGVVTGDTLCAAEDPVGIDGWEIPEPLLPVAVTAADRNAQDAMARGLARLLGTETTLRVDRNAETHQIVLWCTGEAHADVVLDRLRATGATVEVTEVAVPARETVAGRARGLGRHVKQSGGHGQFAVCTIEIEPLPEGSGIEFSDRIVGGAIPRAYIPGVEKGVRAQLETGVTPGRPVVDVRVTLLDGKAHSVDSSDQAFQTAGALAVREAVAAAGTVLLEPVHEVEVTVDDDLLGAVLGDLAARHGRVVGTEPDPEHRRHTRIHAEVPEAALRRYAVDLRALSGGAAHFTRRFSRYESVAAD